jgi:hypothetical protein
MLKIIQVPSLLGTMENTLPKSLQLMVHIRISNGLKLVFKLLSPVQSWDGKKFIEHSCTAFVVLSVRIVNVLLSDLLGVFVVLCTP